MTVNWLMKRLHLTHLVLAGGIFMSTTGMMLLSPGQPYPTNITLTIAPQTNCQGGCSLGQAPDNLPAGATLATVAVTMSDGTQCTDFNGTCPLTSSNTAFFTISGANVIAQHTLTSSDLGTQSTTISTL